ncbi:MAG: CAF17-like 4Fe-4S cluster assembly/insertion protein YgfZ [Algiphilus sp.]
MNSPKGRVIATMVVCRLGEDVGLLVAADIADALCQRLRMFVLRSKVQIALDEETPVTGLIETAPAAAGTSTPAWQCTQQDHAIWLRAPGGHARWWCIGAPPAAVEPHPNAQAFALGDIACGLPCVGQPQTEAHVAQHLGLQHFEALSFSKGCFTGQEVIARLHYRGGINRIPIRLRSQHAARPAGSAIKDGDGRTVAEIVNTAAHDEGIEALAVWRGTEVPGQIAAADACWEVVDFDPPRPT